MHLRELEDLVKEHKNLKEYVEHINNKRNESLEKERDRRLEDDDAYTIAQQINNLRKMDLISQAEWKSIITKFQERLKTKGIFLFLCVE